MRMAENALLPPYCAAVPLLNSFVFHAEGAGFSAQDIVFCQECIVNLLVLLLAELISLG